MKILSANQSIGRQEGGTNERVYQMTRFLLNAGEEVTLLVINGRASRRADIEPHVERHLVRVEPLNERFGIPRIGWRRLLPFVRNCDVIHLMNHWSVLNALLYLAARQCSRPYVVCPAGSLRIYGRSKQLKRLYNFVIGSSIVRNAKAVIAIVPDEIPDIVSAGGSRERIVVVPNAIDPDDYRWRDAQGFRARHRLENVPFILFLGRLSPIKGPDLLVEAFGRAKGALDKYHLVLAGADDEHFWPTLRGIAGRHGVADRVHYIGLLGSREKSEALHEAEFLAIPSRHEAMSIVVLEAGAVGIPVLMTDRCGLGEVETVGGGKVVAASVEGLLSGLVDMTRCRDEFARMGDRLRKFCLERYSWPVVVESYRRLFHDIAAGKHSAEDAPAHS
ncbi:MAG TPA: glycosyltransferase [Thermoanaerobaculia bacterium]|nr:glycosyltransferase [Thermoanaerobaculia bacterium]